MTEDKRLLFMKFHNLDASVQGLMDNMARRCASSTELRQLRTMRNAIIKQGGLPVYDGRGYEILYHQSEHNSQNYSGGMLQQL